MKSIIFLIVLLPTYHFMCLTSAEAQSRPSLSSAKPGIKRLIEESGAEVVGLAVYDLETNQSLMINERVSLHAASTMKLPVMMEVFRLVDEKKLDLNGRIKVRNMFSSIVDGSPYSISSESDSDSLVHENIGKEMKLIDLVNRMITWSSNLATNIVIDIVGAGNVNRLMRNLGANDIQVRRGVEDLKAFSAGLNNTTTAYDLMLLLKLIAENKFLNRDACKKMSEILAAQNFRDGIPAGLPSGTRVAHKTGSITRHKHDAGIIFIKGRRPYVLVVLTKGIEDGDRSGRLIAEISGLIYKSLINRSNDR